MSAPTPERPASIFRRWVTRASRIGPRFRVVTLVLLVACAAVVLTLVKHLGGTDTTVQLWVLLNDKDAARRWDAAKALAAKSRRDPRTLAAMISALDDPNPVVREMAAEELAGWDRSAAAAAIPRLSRSLADPNPAVRRAAARTLGLLIVPSDERRAAVMHALAELLEDDETRYDAAWALVHLGDMKSAMPTLIDELGDREPSIRWDALNVFRFGGIGREAHRAIPALRTIVGDKAADFDERRAAGEVLMRLGKPEPMIQLLQEGQSSHDPEIRRECAEDLRRLAPPPPSEDRSNDDEGPAQRR